MDAAAEPTRMYSRRPEETEETPPSLVCNLEALRGMSPSTNPTKSWTTEQPGVTIFIKLMFLKGQFFVIVNFLTN